MDRYVEPGGSWRPLWSVAAACAAFLALDLALPGPDVAVSAWALVLVAVPGSVGMGCLSARRARTVRVEGLGRDGALTVGRERVVLSEVDTGHLRGVGSGVDAGAPVLGGGWSLPRGWTGLPFRLVGGRTVLVPTRDPAALRNALLAAVSSPRGTLDP